MSLRSRFAAVATAIALLAGSAVLISASPANASVLELTVTSAADTSGTCPSANNCTLRQALADSSSGGVNDGDDVVITIAQGIGTITVQVAPLGYDGGSGGAHALTINGNGATLDGGGAFGILFSQTTGLVSLSSLTLQHGSSTSPGAAVFATGDLEISDATVSNNISTQSGGAVFSASSISLDHVSFSGNVSPGVGGAVFASVTANVSNATFSNNVGNVGGALHANVEATITDSSFTNNNATTGGAISSNNLLDVSRSVFAENSAQNNGGAALSFGTGIFRFTEFSANTVLSNSGLGGAVLLNGNSGSSIIEDSVFNFNASPGGGGAVLTEHELTLSRTSFHQNSANNGTGGAVNTDGPVSVSDSSFSENLADIAGALSGINLTINDSDFSENVAQVDIAAVYGNAVSINRSSFDSNSAARDYGAVNSTGLLTVAQSSFTNNVAGRQIAVAQSNGAVSFVNTTIVGNSSQGPLILGFGNVQLKYSTVTENVVTTNQNSLVIFSGGVISLFGNVLTNSSPNVDICSGATSSSGYNYANDTSCGLTAIGDNENVTNNPLLGALGDHGGNTLTQLPLVGSPLIGAIPSGDCQTGGAPSFDQRGFARPNVPGGPCDIGAVQLTPQMSASLSGRTLTVSITEFTSAATITLQSGSILLGTIAVDATGSGTATYNLECSVPAGSETITASANGGQTATAAIDLEACTPEVIPVFAG